MNATTGALLLSSALLLTAINAPSARSGHTGVWAGSRLLVWGGLDAAGLALGTGAACKP